MYLALHAVLLYDKYIIAAFVRDRRRHLSYIYKQILDLIRVVPLLLTLLVKIRYPVPAELQNTVGEFPVTVTGRPFIAPAVRNLYPAIRLQIHKEVHSAQNNDQQHDT